MVIREACGKTTQDYGKTTARLRELGTRLIFRRESKQDFSSASQECFPMENPNEPKP